MDAYGITSYLECPCRTYYGLPDSFPLDQLLTRTYTGKKRNIYLASKLVKELTRRNELSVKVLFTACYVVNIFGTTDCSYSLRRSLTLG